MSTGLEAWSWKVGISASVQALSGWAYRMDIFVLQNHSLK